MGDDKKERFKNPAAWAFHMSMLVLGAVIALNLAVVFLRPVLPWLVGGIVLVGITWCVVAAVRWRRSRW
jgi:fatty acid desaturase